MNSEQTKLEQLPKTPWWRRLSRATRRALFGVFAISLLAHGLIAVLAFSLPPDSKTLIVDLFPAPKVHRVSFLKKPDSEEVPQWLKARASGKASAAKRSDSHGPASGTSERTARLARRLSGESGVMGLLAAKKGGSRYGLDSAFGADAKDALGSLAGDKVGESYGTGGLGLSGAGRGGGGVAYGRGAGPLSGKAVASFAARFAKGRAADRRAADRRAAARRAAARRAQIAQAYARRLTAATVGDVDRYDNYLSYLRRHSHQAARLGLKMNRRLRVRVVDGNGKPINAARLEIVQGQNKAVRGTSHADGYWDFFPDVSSPKMAGPARLRVAVGAQSRDLSILVPRHGDGKPVTVTLPQAAAKAPGVLDLAFVIDVTGSMSDELRYVTHEVSDVVRRIKKSVPNTRVRVAAVLYRDRADPVPLQMLPFTTNIKRFRDKMARVRAGGGGDYPEDMNAGLATGFGKLQWSQGNAVRVMLLLADAPPKTYPNARYRYAHAMRDASARGIRILPVAASGANRQVEYLFRAMGVFTSTPYAYLTNDSGIGGHHMDADTDRVAVEKFNDLLTRLVISDLRGEGMHEPGALGPQRGVQSKPLASITVRRPMRR
jgi:hypothetical protein